MKKKNKKQLPNDDLIGIDQIAWFAERNHVTLLEWRKDFEFPMWKDKDDLIWVSSRKAIKKWYAEHNANPRTITREKLIQGRTRRMRERGEIKIFNKTLKGLLEIANFFNATSGEVSEWADYLDCPIERLEDGTFQADGDALEIWLEKTGRKLAPGVSPGPKKGRDLFREGYERF